MGTISTPYRPTGTDPRSIAGILNDFDTIYNEFNGEISNVNIQAAAAIELSKLKASPAPGQVVVSNDTGVPTYKTISGDITISDTGVAAIGVGVITKADLAAALQELLVPAGTVLATGRSTAPSGYLMCDGAAVSRTTYADLFTAIGTAYGAGDGSTTFNLPDLRGRVPMGEDPGGSIVFFSRTLGEINGTEFHTLTEAQIPSHTHAVNHTQLDNTSATGAAERVRTIHGDGSGSQNRATNPTGGGGAHYNMPPYQVVNYMVKT